MKGTVKAIIAGAIIIGIGLSIVILAGALNGWDFYGADWTTKSYTCDTQVSNLELDFSADDLTIEFYNGYQIMVEYSESNLVTTEFTVTDTTLKINTDVRPLFGFWWFNKIPAMKLYIPRAWQINYDIEVNAGAVSFADDGNYGNVKLKINAGAVDVGDIECASFALNMNAGAVSIDKLICNVFSCDMNAGALNVKKMRCGDIALDLSAGSAKLKIDGKKSDYSIRTNVSAGSCNVKNQSGNTVNVLKVDVSAGSANISFDE